MGKLMTIWLVVLVCAAGLASVVPLHADTIVYQDADWVTLTGAAGTHYLKATVTYVPATELFTYEYLVSYTSAANFYRFSVANPYSLAYVVANNDRTDKFNNPSYTGTNSISWGRKTNSGTLPGPVTVKFWYTSVYGFRTNVNTSVFAGSATTSSSGSTVGMNLPEPTSVMTLGAGLCGVGAAFIRRVRRRK